MTGKNLHGREFFVFPDCAEIHSHTFLQKFREINGFDKVITILNSLFDEILFRCMRMRVNFWFLHTVLIKFHNFHNCNVSLLFNFHQLSVWYLKELSKSALLSRKNFRNFHIVQFAEFFCKKLDGNGFSLYLNEGWRTNCILNYYSTLSNCSGGTLINFCKKYRPARSN